MVLEKKAFTLIELMVVITIMFILSMMIYAPYQHYQTKQKVRNSAKVVTQTLQQARNLAINWISTGTWNTSIWVLFESGSTDITLLQYPHGEGVTSSSILEKKKLEPWVKISWDKLLFFYEAISWSGTYYKNDMIINDKNLEVSIWFGWAHSWNLNKKIDYYTRTYVSDVQ